MKNNEDFLFGFQVQSRIHRPIHGDSGIGADGFDPFALWRTILRTDSAPSPCLALPDGRLGLFYRQKLNGRYPLPGQLSLLQRRYLFHQLYLSPFFHVRPLLDGHF